MDRSELMDEAALEGETNVVVDELSGKDEIGLDDLRNLPGAKGLEDAELQKLWDEVKAETNASPGTDSKANQAAAVANAVGGEAVKTARGWKVFDDKGNEVADLSKMTAEQFFGHKIGYTANKGEHRKSIDELIRVAQFGHLNEGKLSQTRAERDRFHQEVSSLRPQLEQAARLNNAVRYAITQYNVGNDKPLSELISAVKQNMGKEGLQQPQQQLSSSQPQNSNSEAEGQRVWYEQIQPAADQIAQRFGAKQEEVRNAVRQFVEREPELTMEKLYSYINDEIPLLLQDVGYREGGAKAPAKSGDIADLQKQLADVKAQLANSTVSSVRDKMKKIPGSTRNEGSASSGDPEAIPAEAIKSRDAYRKLLRS